jgi:hypothetical protein
LLVVVEVDLTNMAVVVVEVDIGHLLLANLLVVVEL